MLFWHWWSIRGLLLLLLTLYLFLKCHKQNYILILTCMSLQICDLLPFGSHIHVQIWMKYNNFGHTLCHMSTKFLTNTFLISVLIIISLLAVASTLPAQIKKAEWIQKANNPSDEGNNYKDHRFLIKCWHAGAAAQLQGCHLVCIICLNKKPH